MNRTSCIHVNLSAVEHNLRLVRGVVGPDCRLCPIVKADAYGLGAAPIARHLRAAGADALAVYTPAQAAELARSAVGGPILVLAPVRHLERADEAYRLLIRGDLHLTVHDADHLDDLLRLAERYAVVIPVHLEIDSGMGRGGCRPEAAPPLAARIAASRWLRAAGVSTHFADAGADGDFTDRQLRVFGEVIDRCAEHLPDDCLIHAANTYATLRGRRYHRRMVRVGQAWAGYGSEWLTGGTFRGQGRRLRPVVTWTSQLVAVKTIERGETVGYGRAWTARRRSRIGLVPVGYADGYPRALASTDAAAKPPCVGVEAGGATRYVAVVGQVNMDQMMIDLTDVAGPRRRGAAEVGPGTPVTLIGADPDGPNHVPTLARAAGTVPHEVLCRLSPRVERLYHATEPYDRRPASRAPAARRAAAGSGRTAGTRPARPRQTR